MMDAQNFSEVKIILDDDDEYETKPKTKRLTITEEPNAPNKAEESLLVVPAKSILKDPQYVYESTKKEEEVHDEDLLVCSRKVKPDGSTWYECANMSSNKIFLTQGEIQVSQGNFDDEMSLISSSRHVTPGLASHVARRSSADNTILQEEIGLAIIRTGSTMGDSRRSQTVTRNSILLPVEVKLDVEEMWEERVKALEYEPVPQYAKDFVSQGIVKFIGKDKRLDVELPPEPLEFEKIWPTIENFTPEIGKQSVDEFIMFNSSLMEMWLYTVNLIDTRSDDVSDLYLYEAKFSIPSNMYPVPQATASVFFQMEVSHVIPPSCIVTVKIKYEGGYSKFPPETLQISDRSLFRIIDSKLALFKNITF